MTFEEWYDGYMYWHDEDEVDQEYLVRIAQGAWEAAFEEGYKFANKENEEYDKTLTGDSAV